VNVPNWYELILLSLAAWRVFQLIAFDTIMEGARRYVTRAPKDWDGESPITAKSYRETVALFIQCPYCAGFWIGLLWWGAWLLWPHGTTVAAVPFAISAGVIAGDRLLSSE
jgi:hypothetical protein